MRIHTLVLLALTALVAPATFAGGGAPDLAISDFSHYTTVKDYPLVDGVRFVAWATHYSFTVTNKGDVDTAVDFTARHSLYDQPGASFTQSRSSVAFVKAGETVAVDVELSTPPGVYACAWVRLHRADLYTDPTPEDNKACADASIPLP